MIPAAPISTHTADTLHLISGDPRKDEQYALFLAAAWQCAQENDGLVLTNRVRELLTDANGDLLIFPRLLSALYCRATAKGGPLQKTGGWQVCHDPRKKNDGRPQHVRRWVGPAPTDPCESPP